MGFTSSDFHFETPSSSAAAETIREADAARHLEIEIDDPERGLPCRVIYRPDSDTRDVIWQARFEEGFCHRKAKETRLILESRGWICATERPKDQARLDRSGRVQTVVAVWRCEQGLEAKSVERDPGPPLPAARPRSSPSRGEPSTTPANSIM